MATGSAVHYFHHRADERPRKGGRSPDSRALTKLGQAGLMVCVSVLLSGGSRAAVAVIQHPE